MALLLKNGAVFLHIPKTGGTWISEVLDKLGLISRELGYKHCGVDRLLPEPYLCPDYGKTLTPAFMLNDIYPVYPLPFLFIFVRNPITWYESWFKFSSRPERNWKPINERRGQLDYHVCTPLNGCGYEGIEFNAFVKNVMNIIPGYVTYLYSTYIKLGVQFVGRQENLREGLIKVLKQMKVDFDPEFVRSYHRVGVSPEPQNPVKWEADVLEEVTRLEYAGLIRFGYEKNSIYKRTYP